MVTAAVLAASFGRCTDGKQGVMGMGKEPSAVIMPEEVQLQKMRKWTKCWPSCSASIMI